MSDEPKVSIEALIALHHQETNRRLDRIERKIDDGHSHRENPTWVMLVPIFMALVGAILVVG